MYLVLLRHSMDDLPLRLFGEHQYAHEYASSVDWSETPKIRDLLTSDASTPISVCILKFDDDGEPESLELVRLFDDEPVVEAKVEE